MEKNEEGRERYILHLIAGLLITAGALIGVVAESGKSVAIRSFVKDIMERCGGDGQDTEQ